MGAEPGCCGCLQVLLRVLDYLPVGADDDRGSVWFERLKELDGPSGTAGPEVVADFDRDVECLG
jgi:hypothetical protein